MSAIIDTGPSTPCPQPFNLTAHVLGRADDLHDKVALSILSRESADNWTFRALKSAVLGTATGLLEAGLAPGQKIMLRLGNTVDFPIVYLAAIAVGLHPIPLSAQLTAAELEKLCSVVEPDAVTIDPQLDFPDSVTAKRIPLSDLKNMRNLPGATYQMGDKDRLAYLVFTSGTSGRPKAVMHAHRAVWARQMMINDWYDLRENDRLLHAGAFNWTYTLGTGLLDPWSIGATALIPSGSTNIEDIPFLLAKHDATIFAAAPGVYRRMLKVAPFPALPMLRHGLSAGEKLSDTLRDEWRRISDSEIYEAFGMSECSTFISSSVRAPALPETLGRPQRGRRVAILSSGTQGELAEFGETGLIAVDRRDPGLMLGYLGEDYEHKYQGDWFLTGDMGQMYPDGSVRYMGRDDDVMTAGGYRVSPIEVEAHLLTHPRIQTVAVKDIEIKEDTRIIAAFYTSETDLVETDLQDFANAKLARYKQPRLYIRVEALPVGPNGKLLRRDLSLPKE